MGVGHQRPGREGALSSRWVDFKVGPAGPDGSGAFFVAPSLVESKPGEGYDECGGNMSSQDEQALLRSFVGSLNPRMESVSALPTFSIVMPSYNQAQFIERSILSVLNQDYPNVELIVMDGGSTDGTVEIIEKYSKYIAHWVSERDEGQSDAMNKGFARASGEMMGWLNSDDLYLPGAFRRVMQVFRERPDCSIVIGDWWMIDAQDSILDDMPALDFRAAHIVYEGPTLLAQAMFWTREAHRRFGEFDVAFHRNMDLDFYLRLAANEGEERFARVSSPLGTFRRHPDQKTMDADDNSRREVKTILERAGYGDRFGRMGGVKRLFYRTRRLYWYGKRRGAGYVLSKATGSLKRNFLGR